MPASTRSCVRPFGLADLGALALLEDDHVRRDFGMRREGRVGQADRSHELGALGDPSAGGGFFLSSVPLDVTKATMPPGLTKSSALAKNQSCTSNPSSRWRGSSTW